MDNPDQVRGLVRDVQSCLGRDHLAVLIDQEGGRVQRLCPPHWRAYPPMGLFGDVFEKDPDLAREALALNVQLIGLDLRALGITVACLPVLDVPIPGADDIIGDRAFSTNPAVISDLGRVAMDALMSAQVLPIIKHIPGHGRALVDSHKALPLVRTSHAELSKSDFLPFEALRAAPFAMTAHVVYQAIDRDAPATFSKRIVQNVIRGEMGFEGLLISDDLCMHALYGSFRKRAEMTLAAGVDLLLHCSGNLSEMILVMGGTGTMPDESISRLATSLQKALEGDAPVRAEVLEKYLDCEQKMKAISG